MTLFKRIFAAGFIGFYRNRTVSLSSILILTITLCIITSLFLFNAVFNYTVGQVESKVDISIYFKPEATDDALLAIRTTLQGLPETKNVSFVSRDDTLEQFKTKHADDAATMQALNEIATNPFGASMSVQAKQTNQYATIIQKIETDKVLGDNSQFIDKINYVDVKDSIEKLTNVVSWFSSIGYVLAIVFMIMSVLIVYNTTRLAIFTFREEISVMKLVGASNMYIRGPFVVEAAIYGVVASFAAILVSWPAVAWLGIHTTSFFEGLNIFSYFKDHLLELFAILLGAGIFVSIISAMLAVRKYLQV
jgi:cell division transport system permease protein